MKCFLTNKCYRNTKKVRKKFKCAHANLYGIILYSALMICTFRFNIFRNCRNVELLFGCKVRKIFPTREDFKSFSEKSFQEKAQTITKTQSLVSRRVGKFIQPTKPHSNIITSCNPSHLSLVKKRPRRKCIGDCIVCQTLMRGKNRK